MKSIIGILCSISLTLSLQAQFLINPYRFAGGGGGGDLAAIKTSMVSWYDFDADANDDHSNNNWTVTGTPTYSSGAITITAATNTLAIGAGAGSLGYEFMPSASETDATVCMWVASNAATGAGEDVVQGKTNRILIEHNATSSGWSAQLGNTNKISSNSGVPVDDQFYFVVVTYDSATDTSGISYDNSTPVTGSVAYSGADNNMSMPGDCKCAWLGFWNRKLSTTEITALYTAGTTLTYSSLP